ncbi:MAG: hypothetical protein HY814_13620 [Candidatus Riflebacteria bacterium]|nr:hypothetical protein [Candidatus Riflebacteria bacterium]
MPEQSTRNRPLKTNAEADERPSAAAAGPGVDETAPATTAPLLVGPESAGPRTYSEKEVGQIIALATKLQMQTRPNVAPAGPTSRAQLLEIARAVGVGDQYVDKALGLFGQGEGSLVCHGSVAQVRQRLAEHFAGAIWHPGGAQHAIITPRISFDGQTGLSVAWGTAVLRLHLRAEGEDSTELTWEASYPELTVNNFWANVVFGLLGIGPALVIAAAGAFAPAVIWGLFVGGSLAAGRVLQNSTQRMFARRFMSFCRTHLENLQLLLLPRA